MKLLLGLTTAIGLTMTAGTAMADYSLSIFHFNDFHARFESISKYDSSCSEKNEAADKCFGGIARIKSKLDERRAALDKDGQPHILTVAGDAFQGTLFYTKYKGEATANFFNSLDIAGFALGNHEFDDGPSVLSDFIGRVSFPILGGNIDTSAEPLLAGKFKGYRIINEGADRVALIGIVTTDTVNIAAPGKNVKFINNQTYLSTVIPEIKAMGVNKIVVISHAGYPEDVELAENVAGIDVIVGGHSNTFMSNTNPKASAPYPDVVRGPDNNLVAIVQAYAYSKYLGEVKVDFDDAGNLTGATGDPHLLDANVKPDADFSARLEALAGPLNAEKNIVVASAATVIDGDRTNCRAIECEMGNLVSDAMLDRTKDQGISIAIQNGGGLRASIDAGEITKGEVLTVLPFQNTLSTFQLKGSDVIAALENGVSQVEDGKGRFPQVAGIRYAWDGSVEPLKGRIKQVQVMEGHDWVDIDPSKVYGVVSNNFLRSGGDGYKIFANNGMNAYDFGPGLEDVVITYLQNHAPYSAYTDGRIVAGTSLAAAKMADEKMPMKAEEKAPMKVEEKAEKMPMKVEEKAEKMPAKKAEMKAAKPEMKAEKVEMKAEKPEMKAEKVEMKAEKPEMKAEKVEMKAEKPKMKAEKVEMKAEKPEMKAEKAEMKAEEKVAMKSEDKMDEKPAEKMSSDYTVMAGDSLWKIAEKHYGEGHMWKKIQKANNLRNARSLTIGQMLKLPK